MNLNENFIKAIDLYNKNNVTAALKIYKSLIKTKKSYYLYYNIGVCYLELKKYYNAIDSFKKSIDLNYLHCDSYINLAYCYYKLKDYKRCYRTIKTGYTYTQSQKLLLIENKLFKIMVNGG